MSNLENKKKELSAFIEEATSLEAESTAKREAQKELLRDKETFFEAMTKLTSSLEQCRLDYDNLTAKLFDTQDENKNKTHTTQIIFENFILNIQPPINLIYLLKHHNR